MSDGALLLTPTWVLVTAASCSSLAKLMLRGVPCEDLVICDLDASSAIEELLDMICRTGKVHDRSQARADVLADEQRSSTGFITTWQYLTPKRPLSTPFPRWIKSGRTCEFWLRSGDYWRVEAIGRPFWKPARTSPRAQTLRPRGS